MAAPRGKKPPTPVPPTGPRGGSRPPVPKPKVVPGMKTIQPVRGPKPPTFGGITQMPGAARPKPAAKKKASTRPVYIKK